jgi:hypothetical protein
MPSRRGRLARSALALLALAAAGAEEKPQALAQGEDLILKVHRGDGTAVVSLGNIIATAPEPIAIQLLAEMARATDDVGLQDAAIQGLHNLAPEVRRAAIITVAILGRAASAHGSEIRHELLESDYPGIVRAAEDYAAYAHDDLAIPDLIRLLGDGKQAEVVEGAHKALTTLAGKDLGTSGSDWSTWYQERIKAVNDQIQTVRAAYGKKDKMAEIQAVRGLFGVSDLTTLVLDALVDLSHNDPDKEIRQTAEHEITGLACVSRYEYEAGLYTPTHDVFEGGAPLPSAPVPEAAAEIAAPPPSSHLGMIITGVVVAIAIAAAFLLRPKRELVRSRPAALLIRRGPAPPPLSRPAQPRARAPAPGAGAGSGQGHDQA